MVSDKTFPQPKKHYLGCLIGDNPLGFKIALISDQQFVYILTGISINFIQPLFNIIEALLISHIINHLLKCEDKNIDITISLNLFSEIKLNKFK